jgi:hypothetical protein
MAVNTDLYVTTIDEFAYLTTSNIGQTVSERDKNGVFKFPAIVRCCFVSCFGSLLCLQLIVVFRQRVVDAHTEAQKLASKNASSSQSHVD